VSTSSTDPARTGSPAPGGRRPLAVVAGEALVDIVVPTVGEHEQAPGGSPLNVAVGLSRLGIDTLLVTELGDDHNGRLVEHHVRDSGVQLHPDAVRAGRVTSTATARLDATGAATYDFDLRWELSRVDLPQETDALHVGSVGALLRPGRDAVLDLVEAAARRGSLVSYDPNARPALTPDAAQTWLDVQEVAASADLVKMSDEDLAVLAAGRTPEEVAGRLLAERTRLFVVTHGGGGAVAFTTGCTVSVPSGRVEVVDTVGAGDSFMAALVAVALEHGLEDLDESRLAAYLAAAHQVGAVTVSRRGADPPRRAELPPGWPNVGSRVG
jgi:fructokinase